jgi:hypothetical protein
MPSAVSEQFSELIGCPVSKSLTTCCVCLELRSLPSTGVTRLPRYCEPLRHPKAPDLSLAGVRLVIADHAMGLPVLRTLSLCTCRRHYPGAAAGRTTYFAHSPSRISLPRKSGRVGLRIVLFEVCSAFTRVTACTLALSPIRDTLTEGFSHFVTSMTAPVASGCAVAGWDLHPLESAAFARRTPQAAVGFKSAFGPKGDTDGSLRQAIPTRARAKQFIFPSAGPPRCAGSAAPACQAGPAEQEEIRGRTANRLHRRPRNCRPTAQFLVRDESAL